MARLQRPRLPVKSATARFFADCLRSDRTEDRQRILRELQPALITVVKTRKRRFLFEQREFTAAELLDDVFKPFTFAGSDRRLAKIQARKRWTMLLGCEYAGLKQYDPLRGLEPSRGYVLFIDVDRDLHPTVEQIVRDHQSLSYYSINSTDARPRSRHVVLLRHGLPISYLQRAYAALNALDPKIQGGIKLPANVPIDVIDGPETTLFVRTGPRIGWLTLCGLLKLADAPSSAPVRPRLQQPQPTVPVQLPAPTQSDDEGFPWLARQYADRAIRERAWRHALGDRIVKYPGAVSCPFAGHANADATPSASLAHKVGMLPLFKCHAAVHGMPDGRHHNIGELYRLIVRRQMI